MYKIFVVEDDAVIAGAVVEHIASWGWEARKAEAQPSAYRVPLIGIGQHECGHGDEYGRGRFYCQAF